VPFIDHAERQRITSDASEIAERRLVHAMLDGVLV
jgi:hypothetical protein